MKIEEEKIPAIDGKMYTKNELVRVSFLFIGGEWKGRTAKTINGVVIESLSMSEVLNIGKEKS